MDNKIGNTGPSLQVDSKLFENARVENGLLIIGGEKYIVEYYPHGVEKGKPQQFRDANTIANKALELLRQQKPSIKQEQFDGLKIGFNAMSFTGGDEPITLNETAKETFKELNNIAMKSFMHREVVDKKDDSDKFSDKHKKNKKRSNIEDEIELTPSKNNKDFLELRERNVLNLKERDKNGGGNENQTDLMFGIGENSFYFLNDDLKENNNNPSKIPENNSNNNNNEIQFDSQVEGSDSDEKTETKSTGNSAFDKCDNIKEFFDLDPVKSDGNCLFAAIGKQVNKSQQEVRDDIAKEIEKNYESYSAYISGDLDLEVKDKSFPSSKDYAESIRSCPEVVDGERPFWKLDDQKTRKGWGGEAEIRAAGWVYDKNIVMRDPESDEIGYIDEDGIPRSWQDDGQKNEEKGSIYLFYNGVDHYDAMKLKKKYQSKYQSNSN